MFFNLYSKHNKLTGLDRINSTTNETSQLNLPPGFSLHPTYCGNAVVLRK